MPSITLKNPHWIYTYEKGDDLKRQKTRSAPKKVVDLKKLPASHCEELLQLVENENAGKPSLSRKASASNVDKTIQGLLNQWMKSLASGGSNNSITYGGIKRVVEAMHKTRKLTKQSVFIDMGSGAGVPCIYVALKFGCKTIGIEYDPALVKIANDFAKQAGVSDLCTFIAKDFNDLPKNFLHTKKVTHLFTYDGVFPANVWNPLFDRIGDYQKQLVGASVSRFSSNWPQNLKLVQRVSSVKLAGGKSSFTFGVWVN